MRNSPRSFTQESLFQILARTTTTSYILVFFSKVGLICLMYALLTVIVFFFSSVRNFKHKKCMKKKVFLKVQGQTVEKVGTSEMSVTVAGL